MKLDWTTLQDESIYRYVISLSGEVTEEFDPIKLDSLKSILLNQKSSQDIKNNFGPVIVFDFANLARLNSVGVRSLLKLIEIVPKNFSIIYRNCVPVFIEQINIIPDFLFRGEVESLFVNEYCPNHNLHYSRLLTIGNEIKKGVSVNEALNNLPAAICSQCSADLEFYDDPNIYLAFLER